MFIIMATEEYCKVCSYSFGHAKLDSHFAYLSLLLTTYVLDTILNDIHICESV